jgi:hypothetical protein
MRKRMNKDGLVAEAARLDEKSLTAEWRAVVSLCREYGFADLLRIPDDIPLLPALSQAGKQMADAKANTKH